MEYKIPNVTVTLIGKTPSLHAEVQRNQQLLGCIGNVQGVIRDMKMQVAFYEAQAAEHQRKADSVDLNDRLVHRTAALTLLDVADDTRRRVAQIKEATKLR